MDVYAASVGGGTILIEEFTSDFKTGRNSYSFINSGIGHYFRNGGHCAGMTFSSIINLYGKLPARMIFSDDDVKKLKRATPATQFTMQNCGL